MKLGGTVNTESAGQGDCGVRSRGQRSLGTLAWHLREGSGGLVPYLDLDAHFFELLEKVALAAFPVAVPEAVRSEVLVDGAGREHSAGSRPAWHAGRRRWSSSSRLSPSRGGTGPGSGAAPWSARPPTPPVPTPFAASCRPCQSMRACASRHSWLPGRRRAQDARCPAVGNGDMSSPVSARIASADRCPTHGMLQEVERRPERDVRHRDDPHVQLVDPA